MTDFLQWGLLALIGLCVGVLGTLIGAGGGFILIPILLFIYPQESPALLTSISLTVVFFNALSGSISYGRMHRIDLRSGLWFSSAAVPGAISGAYVTSYLNRELFQLIFGVILLLVAVYLTARPRRKHGGSHNSISGGTVRKITDSNGLTHSYSFNMPLGIGIAFFIGVIGGMLGLGGGIMHVPALTQVLGFPAHIATATSHMVVAITVLAAIGTHAVSGTMSEGILRALVLAAGAVIGAPFGARLSQRVSETVIIRLLAAGLGIVAVRLLIAPF